MNKIQEILEDKSKLYFVGEISCNHNHDLSVVKKTIKKLAEIGADAVKIQTDFMDGTGSTMNFQTDFFKIKGTIWENKNLWELYKEAYTPIEWHEEIFEYASTLGIECFSTPYSESSVEFLSSMDMPAIKVASMEASDLEFVSRCASLQKPIIISTGMLEPHEFENVVQACRSVGNENIVLLNCTSEYPAPPEKSNASIVKYFSERFGVITGLSDHTKTSLAAQLTVAFGGQVYEKHIKLDNTITGPDASFSLTVEDFAGFMSDVRLAQSVSGVGKPVSRDIDKNYSRSVFVIEDVASGEIISDSNVRVIRPGHGLHPNRYRDVLGKKFSRDIKAGNPLLDGDFRE